MLRFYSSSDKKKSRSELWTKNMNQLQLKITKNNYTKWFGFIVVQLK